MAWKTNTEPTVCHHVVDLVLLITCPEVLDGPHG